MELEPLADYLLLQRLELGGSDNACFTQLA